MQKLWQQVFGSVRFSAQGGDSARLLTLCMEQGIALSFVRADALGFSAWVPARQYRRLHLPARRCRVRVRITNRRGIVFSLRSLRGRWGIPAGALLCLLLTFWMQQYIWTVSYYKLPAETAVQLAVQLEQNGLSPGVRPTSAQMLEVRQKILLQNPQFSSLSFQFVKGRLIVEAIETEQKPEILDNLTPADIVADKDGILVSMEVYTGYAVRRVGQAVQRGDLLVSHTYTDAQTQQTVTGHARAKIVAQTETVFCCEQSFSTQLALPTGSVYTEVTLRSGNWRLPLFAARNTPTLCSEKTTVTALAPMDWALPFSLEKHTVTELSQQTVVLTPEQAARRARLACDEKISTQLGNAKILSRQYEEHTTEQSAVCTVTVAAEETIGTTTTPGGDSAVASSALAP